VFASLNVDKIAKDLELVEEGKKRGAQNLPPKSATQYDDIESAVIDKVEDEKKAAHHSLEDGLHLFASRLASLDFEDQFGQIAMANASSVTDFKAEVSVGEDELHGLRKDLYEAERAHALFKEEHGLKRPARLPEGGAHMFRIALVLFLFGAESILNANFLATGNAKGFLGGVIVAMTFSFVNIGIALLIAIFGVRLVVHRNYFLKLLGVGFIFVYAAGAFIINLGLAHYREASGDLLEGAGRIVVERLRNDPTGLADINSWLLFLVGLLFSVFAFIDGWFVLDPYPGYAGYEKRRNAARDNYKERKADLIERLQDVRDEHNEKVEEILKGLGSRQREYRAIIEHRAKIISLFNEHQNHIERVGNQLLTRYREANVQARTDSTTVPKYFSGKFSLKRTPVRATSDGEISDKELSASIKNAQALLNEQVRLIGKECELGIEAYHKLDKLHPDKIDG
jgi:hypothetical protein